MLSQPVLVKARQRRFICGMIARGFSICATALCISILIGIREELLFGVIGTAFATECS